MRVFIVAALMLTQLVSAQLSSSSSGVSSSSSGASRSSSSSVMMLSSSSSSSSSREPNRFPCSGGGYDLSSIRGTQLRGAFSGWNWTVSICDWVQGSCPAQTSFGQLSASGACTTLAQYNATTQAQWMAIQEGSRQGVQMYSMNGAMCGSSPRRSTIKFMCSPSAITPVLDFVSEPDGCHYVAVVNTSAACTASGTTGANGVGSMWQSYDCGGQVYDLTNVGQLMFDSNVTGPTSGYFYHVNLCGRVSAPACASVQPTSVCQVSKENSNLWSLSNLNSSVLQTYRLTADGLSINVANGLRCGSRDREVMLNVHCTGAIPAVITAQREYATCQYSFEINAACPPYGSNMTLSSSSTGPISWNSSSSGQAQDSSSSSAGQPQNSSSSSTGQPQDSSSSSTGQPQDDLNGASGVAVSMVVVLATMISFVMTL